MARGRGDIVFLAPGASAGFPGEARLAVREARVLAPSPLPLHLVGVVLLMSLIVFIRHRANISRLLAGTESRIGSKG